MTMIGQRDVRCCDEIRNRRTRNIRKIWAEMAALGFMRKVSVSRSEKRRTFFLFDAMHYTLGVLQ